MNPPVTRLLALALIGWAATPTSWSQQTPPPKAESEPVKSSAPAVEVRVTELPRQLDLPESLLLALRHSPLISEARAQIREQEGVLIEAKAERMPRIDAVGSHDVVEADRIEGFGDIVISDEQAWIADVRLSHVIYNGGLRNANAKSAEARVNAARSRMQTVVDNVLLETSRNYFDGLLAREEISVQEEAIAVLQTQLKTAKVGFDAGSKPQFDVLQAEVALANAKPPLIRARNQYRIAIDRLRRSIGLPYAQGSEASFIRLSQTWPNPKVNEKLADLLFQAIANRPELAQLADEVRAAEFDIKAAKSLHKPRVEMFGTYGTQSERFSGDAADNIDGATGGVRVSVPLIDMGRTRGEVVQATSRLARIEAQQEQQKLDIEGQVRQSYFDYDEASEILETSQLVVKQAAEALRLAQNRFDAGALTQLDVLQSRLELTRAQLEEVQAVHSYNLAVARLRQAVGTISRGTAVPEPLEVKKRP